jgi:HEAT repeat protein
MSPRSRLPILICLCFASAVLMHAAARAAEPSVRSLVETAANPLNDPQARMHALRDLRSRGAEAVPELLDLLADPDPNTRVAAAGMLAQLDPKDLGDDRVISTLAELLQYEKAALVRMEVLLALGATGDAKAVGPIVSQLDDPELQIRKLAVLALLRLRNPAAATALREQLEKETDREIQISIIRALAACGAVRELEELHRSVTDPDLSAHIDAALAQLEPDRTREPPTSVHPDRDPATRGLSRAQKLSLLLVGALLLLLVGYLIVKRYDY